MSDEEESEDNGEQCFEAAMRAGQLQVSAEGETSEEACNNAIKLWVKATRDLSEMPEEDRNRVGLE